MGHIPSSDAFRTLRCWTNKKIYNYQVLLVYIRASRVNYRIQYAKNASQYTGNKNTYIHSLHINTKTYQQINYLHYKHNYISTNQLHVYTKRKREGHTSQNKVFSHFKGFHNEHGYISYFSFIFCFHKFNKLWHIQSFPIIQFNICFFLNSWNNGHAIKMKFIFQTI